MCCGSWSKPIETRARRVALLNGERSVSHCCSKDLNRATVLPLFRRGSAKSSVERELEHQVENIEREAGVRSHL
ncbi:MAG: hypothetical protein QOH74_1505 [Gaiellales bacterium]|jgi:hypothetical protein|nr:hypothetical protein [Gaiellales bacterium]